ncbi:catalase-like domain-containing protein [Paraphoma chrysanthemicola]|nr:catalase-like domain-containing protein [Paraphoma chrysanthemicola]
MISPAIFTAIAVYTQFVHAACPYMEHDARDLPAHHAEVKRQEDVNTPPASTNDFMAQFEVNDTNAYLTNNAGVPIEDQESLSAGERGPTLLEDFIFREKIMHFDHERVPERAVHARGAGAHGVFTSYGDWSNITGASFLAAPEKETPVFIRFSTVAGSRGSADTVRDVHGFAVRFYTDEGNFDIVGNNIPVFFIQDAIKFPDLIHAVKPRQDNEIPQAATGHDSAWDFFSQQPSSLHTLFWAMSGHGIVRSYRHMDGWGVHTFRFVADDGKTKLVKFRFRTLQGLASRLWEEQQVTAGKNADADRQDLWDAIEDGYYPEWVFEAQIMEEEDQLRFGFDLLDPTKIVPEDIVPFTPLGKLTLNRNPRNYFAETEQIMYQVGHIVRGIDFTDDPLMQGRIFSYLDTQLNRHNGPNFEQLPINRPRVPVHTNSRDGAGQMYIPLNVAAYSPNTLNAGTPRQATQNEGRGFFTAPNRTGGRLVRAVSSTFADVWSQPRLFFNSLLPVEQQFVINAIRFETSQLTSDVIKNNVLIQLNRVSHDIAVRVAQALDLTAPEADDTYYHDNTTTGVSVSQNPLLKIDGLRIGYLTSTSAARDTASALKSAFNDVNVKVTVVAERLGEGIDATYASAFAGTFDAIVVDGNAEALFAQPGSLANSNATAPGNSTTRAFRTLYPAGRPLQILQDGYHWGKAVAVAGGSTAAFEAAGIVSGTPGAYHFGNNDTASIVEQLSEGLRTFRFLDRYPLDEA